MPTDIRERFMDIAVEIIDHAQSCTTQASRRRIVDTLNRAYAAEVNNSEPAVLNFTANIPGVFEVELEQSGLLILELTVR